MNNMYNKVVKPNNQLIDKPISNNIYGNNNLSSNSSNNINNIFSNNQ